MPNPLFNKFGANRNGGNNIPQNFQGNNFLNILNQYRQIQNDPGKILDILLQNGKINQQQYNELQSCKNNPQQIVSYLSQHGNANQINQVGQMVGQLINNK